MAPAACAAPTAVMSASLAKGWRNKCFGKPEVCAMMIVFVGIG